MKYKSYAYRCSKCRGRNTLRQPVEHYVRTPKCRHCGYTSFYIDKARQNRNDICRDDSCCHYPHRYRSTLCIHHPNFEMIDRVRRGETEAQVLADWKKK